MAIQLTKTQYQNAKNEIHLEIGRAIDDWSNIECQLHDIFIAAIVHPSDGIPVGLSAVFWAAQSFEAKLSLVSAAIYHRGVGDTNNAIATAWATLRNKLQDENRNRNKLAHGSVVNPAAVAGEAHKELPVWVPFFDDMNYHLFKQIPQHKRQKAKSFDELTSVDVAAIRSNFASHGELLGSFYITHFAPERDQ